MQVMLSFGDYELASLSLKLLIICNVVKCLVFLLEFLLERGRGHCNFGGIYCNFGLELETLIESIHRLRILCI